MKCFRFTLICLALLVAGAASAGQLDDYYLEQFGEKAATISGTLFQGALPPAVKKCGMPLRKSLRADWSKLENSTRTTLAKYVARPVLSGVQTFTSSGGHFIFHYATSGTDAPPMTTTPPNTAPDWVVTVANVFENVYNTEVTDMGYSAPTNTPYPVYLQQLATQRLFGYTLDELLTGQSATSFIAIDNDFADSIYAPYNGLTGLQITAAHEFHHAIQFHYNYYFEPWYAEATSSWIEDEVYDSVNQLYEYSVHYLQNHASSLDRPIDSGYSTWIFNRLLAENYTQTGIRSIWEKLQQTTVPPTALSATPSIPCRLLTLR